MTDDEIAFLRLILADPDADGPRLVLADWLDEHGQPDRAEFVRLQCAAARGDSAALTPAARARMDELETAHRAAWLGPLARVVFRVAFRRGFAEHVVLPAAAFLAHG